MCTLTIFNYTRSIYEYKFICITFEYKDVKYNRKFRYQIIWSYNNEFVKVSCTLYTIRLLDMHVGGLYCIFIFRIIKPDHNKIPSVKSSKEPNQTHSFRIAWLKSISKYNTNIFLNNQSNGRSFSINVY